MHAILLIVTVSIILPWILYLISGIRGCLYGLNICFSSVLSVIANRVFHFDHTWIFFLVFFAAGAFFVNHILERWKRRQP